MILDDTIVAIATPPGNGAIGIVRISGSNAIEIADKIFQAANAKSLSEVTSHSLVYGSIGLDETIDYILLGIMRGRHSFTGENSAEFYCHGGQVILKKVLDLLCSVGCRPAQPGEFSRRAFLNGKIDLTQAEAIADLIDAPTDKARQAAVRQLEGRLKKSLQEIHSDLELILAELQGSIEFPDDVADLFADQNILAKRINDIRAKVLVLLASADGGRILKDGYRVAICGKPNVGKSSLLNFLAREERALVTHIPGTTRDTLDIDINLDGFPVLLIDTAGLRQTEDIVESLGIERARATLTQSDLIIWVSDSSQNIEAQELAEIDATAKNCDLIWLQNKIDLADCPAQTKLNYPTIKFSTKTGVGLDRLHQQIKDNLISKMPASEDSLYLLRSRHRNLLEKAISDLDLGLELLKTEFLAELLCEDLIEAQRAIGELTGVISSEDLLDKIFADFCIGK